MKAWENNIRKVEPYVPGEQPKDTDVIKLNTNENPYPPAPEVGKAVMDTDIDRLRLYPDPDVTELVSAIADYYGMNKNQMMYCLCASLHFLMEISLYCFQILHIPSTVYGQTCTEFLMRSRRWMKIST